MTIKNKYPEQVKDNFKEVCLANSLGKLSFKGTEVDINKKEVRTSQHAVFSEGIIQTLWGWKPTAAAAEGLTPGP